MITVMNLIDRGGVRALTMLARTPINFTLKKFYYLATAMQRFLEPFMKMLKCIF